MQLFIGAPDFSIADDGRRQAQAIVRGRRSGSELLRGSVARKIKLQGQCTEAICAKLVVFNLKRRVLCKRQHTRQDGKGQKQKSHVQLGFVAVNLNTPFLVRTEAFPK